MFEKLDHKKSLGVWWALPVPVPMLHLSSLACTCCMEHALKLWKNTGNKNCLCARKDGLLRNCCLPAVQNGAKNTIKKSANNAVIRLDVHGQNLSHRWQPGGHHDIWSHHQEVCYTLSFSSVAWNWSQSSGMHKPFLPNQARICKRFTSSLAWFTRKRHSNWNRYGV